MLMASRPAHPLDTYCLDRLSYGRGMIQARLLLRLKDVTMPLPLYVKWLNAHRSWTLVPLIIIQRGIGPLLRLII
jgi:hypothetical protein